MSEQQDNNVAVDYWNEARTPLSSLMFLLPWIAIYELGVLAIGQDQPDAMRNGADFWMRSLLTRAGAGQLLLPLIVVGMLLAWHILRKNPWQVRLETQFGMLAESVLLAVVLVAVGQCHDIVFRSLVVHDTTPEGVLNAMQGSVSQAVSYIGAGVYEEVMFRLLLIPAAFLSFRMFEFPSKYAAMMAAISSSFLFALAHHVGPAAEAFNLFAFSFRVAAGLFFAAVFLLRGFGITVGCHAAYDLLVGILLAR
jgi:membrane protease YdiL (CAAX protease family)